MEERVVESGQQCWQGRGVPPSSGRVEEEGSRDGEVVLSVTESRAPAAGEQRGQI